MKENMIDIGSEKPVMIYRLEKDDRNKTYGL